MFGVSDAVRRLLRACVLVLGVVVFAGLPTSSEAQGAQPFPGIADPGGNPTTPVPVPPPAGKYFGFHELSLGLQTHGWTAGELAGVAAGGGANTARFNVMWWAVEPARDQWSEAGWDRYEELYNAYVARGIRPVLVLQGTPRWAVHTIYSGCGHRRGCEYPPAEWNDPQWEEFSAEVARRFPQAAAIEIWNEPNLQWFFKPNPNPWRYATMVVKAARAINAANPQMQVLGGALAPYQAHSVDKWQMTRFLDTMYVAQPALKTLMDGLSFHTVWQSLDYGAGSMYAKFFHDVRTITAKHGDANVPLWITETGITTTGAAAFSDPQQANGLIAQYRKVMQMPDVKALVIHTLADQVEWPASDLNRGYGLIRGWSPFTPKASYCAFAGRVNTPDPYGPCPRIVEQYPAPPDTAPPDTSITSGPAGTSPGTSATLTYTSSEPGSGFECKIDAQTFSACPATGKSYASLTPGPHTFAVRAVDSSGNTDPTPALRSWAVATPDPGDPGDPTDPEAPAGVGDCSPRMVILRWSIDQAPPGSRRAQVLRYRRVSRRCVPCPRRIARLGRTIHQARDSAVAERLRARRARVKARCAPCVRDLRSLERRAARAESEDAFILSVREHDAARKRCRPRRA